ncbi:hypothetical protein [Chryseobacterium gregarium]|uniref:hypothetical protein n=1 Tax=Chryseobacterium gregarium TaxID=456299 RepID=UPI0004029977|nr:hypothetical protein [Chryseobacterium gregarium]
MLRISYLKIFLFAFISIVLFVLINIWIPNNLLITVITSVLGSVIASIIISIIYQNELHKSFQFYEKCGIKKVYSDFEAAHSDIKNDLSKSRSVEIFLMFGSSFFGTNELTLKKFLSNKSAKCRIFIYSQHNNFIDSYGNQWGSDNVKYNRDGIKSLILNTEVLLKQIYNGIDSNNRADFEIYKIKDAPISYSFYRFDDKLYYVPSKISASKLTKHPVILYEKTQDQSNFYNSIIKEIDEMINTGELEKEIL